MAKASKGVRLPLGEPLQSDFADFRAANYNCPEIEVIREALRIHMDARLQEPAMKKRFDEARKARIAGNTKLTVINGAKD